MHITVSGNTTRFTTASLLASLRTALNAPNNPHSTRAKRVSVSFGRRMKGRDDAVMYQLEPSGSRLSWSGRILLPSTVDVVQYARVLRFLAQLVSKLPKSKCDPPWSTAWPPAWHPEIALELQQKNAAPTVDVLQKRAALRTAGIEAARRKVEEWAKQEVKAARLRAKWEIRLKQLERSAREADERYLKSGKLGLAREDLQRADAAFEEA